MHGKHGNVKLKKETQTQGRIEETVKIICEQI